MPGTCRGTASRYATDYEADQPIIDDIVEHCCSEEIRQCSPPSQLPGPGTSDQVRLRRLYRYLGVVVQDSNLVAPRRLEREDQGPSEAPFVD